MMPALSIAIGACVTAGEIVNALETMFDTQVDRSES
jgi:hypothetical protein